MFKGFCFFMKFGWHSDKRYVIYHILHQCIRSMIPIVSVIMPKYIIDALSDPQHMEYFEIYHLRIYSVWIYIMLFTLYLLLSAILTSWLSLQGFTLRARVASDWGLWLHQKLTQADYENLESPAFLDLKEKANKFLYGDWHGFSYLFECALDILGQFITLCGMIYIIASLNFWMVLLSIALVLISSIFESKAKKKDIALSLEAVKVERGWSYYSQIMEDFQYGKEIRINNLGKWLLDKEKTYAYSAVDFYRRRNAFHIRAGIVSAFMTFVQQIAAYLYVVSQVIYKALTIGDFTLYIGTITAFSSAMRTIMQDFVEIQAYGVYFGAVEQYLSIPSKMYESGCMPILNQEHCITFENVSFCYKGQSTYALKNISLTIRSGEKLAVIGENGAGKTTLIKLLTRCYEPTEGRILLDGIDIRKYRYDQYMELFSAVFQDYKLFAITLMQNVALAKEKTADKSHIESILCNVGLSSLLDSLNNGVDTPVYKQFDESGFEPSGGEGQKIALARAIYKNAPIVILDEPTAALDPRAEYEIYQQFDKLTAGKTAVYISHRLSSTRFCDRIIVLKNGKIVENGTHNTLINIKNSVYSELYSMQSQYYQ